MSSLRLSLISSLCNRISKRVLSRGLLLHHRTLQTLRSGYVRHDSSILEDLGLIDRLSLQSEGLVSVIAEVEKLLIIVGNRCSVLLWRSIKLERVVKSLVVLLS